MVCTRGLTDRAARFGREDWEFESLRVHTHTEKTLRGLFCVYLLQLPYANHKIWTMLFID